jgi:hypothetical protein
MKLIRRTRKPSPAEQVLGYARLGLRGLVAQRVARRAYRNYKFARRLPVLIGVAALAAFVAKKLKGGEEAATPATPAESPPPQPQAAPAEAPAPAPAASASGKAEADAGAKDDGKPGDETKADASGENTTGGKDDGTPKPLAEVVEEEATTPATPSAAGTGGAEGDGVPDDAESAEQSGESTDAAPPED